MLAIWELFRLGSGRLTCDYNAISVQLQLQLPTGTELGKSLYILGIKIRDDSRLRVYAYFYYMAVGAGLNPD